MTAPSTPQGRLDWLRDRGRLPEEPDFDPLAYDWFEPTDESRIEDARTARLTREANAGTLVAGTEFDLPV